MLVYKATVYAGRSMYSIAAIPSHSIAPDRKTEPWMFDRDTLQCQIERRVIAGGTPERRRSAVSRRAR